MQAPRTPPPRARLRCRAVGAGDFQPSLELRTMTELRTTTRDGIAASSGESENSITLLAIDSRIVDVGQPFLELRSIT